MFGGALDAISLHIPEGEEKSPSQQPKGCKPGVILFTWPEIAVSRALLDGYDPSAALAHWKSRATTALLRVKKFDERLISAAQSTHALADQLGIRRTDSEVEMPPVCFSAACLLLVPAASQWVKQDHEALELARDLSFVSGYVRLDPENLGVDQLDASRSLFTKHLEELSNARELAFNTAFAMMRADFERLAVKEGAHSNTAFGAVGVMQKIGAIIERLRSRVLRNGDLARIRDSGLFDEQWYLERFPDVDPGEIDPLMHYLMHGGVEGRPPGPGFDSTSYFVLNPDLEGLGLNPLAHYLRKGRSAGRPALNLQGRPLKI